MSLARLQLKANADKRLRAGHLWVYSNEIDIEKTPFTNITPGDQVIIETASKKQLGIAAASPNNLICARILSRDIQIPLTKSLFVHRFNLALSLRNRLYTFPCYRLIYGDSDLLPGLVIDRFFDIFVIQITSATMENHKQDIIEAVVQLFKPLGILFKNNSSARDAENLTHYVETAYGQVPDWALLEENGIKFEAPIISGQKTGWFYDHRENRARLKPYVKGLRVLDLFSYIGGWGIQAASLGASEVVCIDSSTLALDGVERNAALNNVAEKVSCIESDVFEALKELKLAQERFDIIILDPPALIKRKKDIKNGEIAYRRLNEQAMRLLNKDGLLISASCSMHLSEDRLKSILLSSARHLDRNIQLIERGHQAPDHPVHPAINETGYIKNLVCRLLPNG